MSIRAKALKAYKEKQKEKVEYQEGLLERLRHIEACHLEKTYGLTLEDFTKEGVVIRVVVEGIQIKGTCPICGATCWSEFIYHGWWELGQQLTNFTPSVFHNYNNCSD